MSKQSEEHAVLVLKSMALCKQGMCLCPTSSSSNPTNFTVYSGVFVVFWLRPVLPRGEGGHNSPDSVLGMRGEKFESGVEVISFATKHVFRLF